MLYIIAPKLMSFQKMALLASSSVPIFLLTDFKSYPCKQNNNNNLFQKKSMCKGH